MLYDPYQINQIVSGVVINLFALGLTGFLRSEVIVPTGFTKGVSTSEIAIPLLSKIPIVGRNDLHRRADLTSPCTSSCSSRGW